ncbi:MAG: DNA-packaging protein [Lachnospiraceae bacterium]|nr:DNA-packaging protein [Lachnospiraceae bacterium]
MAEKRFAVRQWEELKKAGGLSASIEQITDILQRDDNTMLTRQEVLDRVAGYFNSCLKVCEDEETGEKISTWAKNPTKSGLAISLGISTQALSDYAKGMNSSGQPYRESPYANRRIQNSDFDIIRKALTIVQCFYEERLGENRNNSGSIFWLLNSNNSRWSNEQEIIVNRSEKQILTVEDLPDISSLPSLGEKPSLPDIDVRAEETESGSRLPFDEDDTDTYL